MRTATAIEISTTKENITATADGVFLTITPEGRMDDVFFLPWDVAESLATKIEHEREDYLRGRE